MSFTSFPSDNTPFSQWETDPAETECDLELDLNEDAMLDLILPPDTPLEDQLAIDDLLDEGFCWIDAMNLLRLRARVAVYPEIQEDPHMLFARWLYVHGRISEDFAE